MSRTSLLSMLAILPLTSCIAKEATNSSGSDTAQTTPSQSTAKSAADSTAEAVTRTVVDTAADSAIEVVRRYYSEINARDFACAYREWGEAGPPGNKTLRQFTAGFDSTTSVNVVIGEVGRIEAAAGSRYLTVPVTVEATDRSNHQSVYRGEYVVRRSVVDRATPAQMNWHLYSAKLSRR
jgi:hypothetical protein